jgi:hypothetical protein
MEVPYILYGWNISVACDLEGLALAGYWAFGVLSSYLGLRSHAAA